jgi:hypothetical protein
MDVDSRRDLVAALSCRIQKPQRTPESFACGFIFSGLHLSQTLFVELHNFLERIRRPTAIFRDAGDSSLCSQHTNERTYDSARRQIARRLHGPGFLRQPVIMREHPEIVHWGHL